MSISSSRDNNQEGPGRLAGRSALVTGGARGIGRAVVERLSSDGASVAFSYRKSKEAAEQLVERIRSTGKIAHAVCADLARLDEVKNMFAEADNFLGGVDILVNNAGETLVKSIADTTESEFDHLVAVNLKAILFLMQDAAHKLRDNGRIINISSINTAMHSPGIAIYAATKGALEQVTYVAAHELGVRGITVNAVSPGPVDTEMLRASNPPAALDMAAASTPLRRLGTPDDIADVVAFLAGPEGRWLTGQNLRASGGLALWVAKRRQYSIQKKRRTSSFQHACRHRLSRRPENSC